MGKKPFGFQHLLHIDVYIYNNYNICIICRYHKHMCYAELLGIATRHIKLAHHCSSLRNISIYIYFEKIIR